MGVASGPPTGGVVGVGVEVGVGVGVEVGVGVGVKVEVGVGLGVRVPVGVGVGVLITVGVGVFVHTAPQLHPLSARVQPATEISVCQAAQTAADAPQVLDSPGCKVTLSTVGAPPQTGLAAHSCWLDLGDVQEKCETDRVWAVSVAFFTPTHPSLAQHSILPEVPLSGTQLELTQ